MEDKSIQNKRKRMKLRERSREVTKKRAMDKKISDAKNQAARSSREQQK